MAVVTLTPQDVDREGVAASYDTLNAADTYTFRNTGSTMLHFKNAGGSVATVTLTTPGTISDLAIQDPTVQVAAGGERFVAMLPTSTFSDSGGKAAFTQDQAAGVTAAVVRT